MAKNGSMRTLIYFGQKDRITKLFDVHFYLLRPESLGNCPMRGLIKYEYKHKKIRPSRSITFAQKRLNEPPNVF
jgi:hypothetical protein